MIKVMIDASVGVKWFKTGNEIHADLALEIKKQKLLNKIEIVVPDLFLLEVVNALLTKSNYDINDLIIIEEVLHRMNMQLIFTNHYLLNSAIKIANAADLTIYDSLYVAAAQAQKTLLFTDDKKILANKNNFNFIKSLSEYVNMGM
jgi:predicted nucleic acid-binding protein